jgi:hypothetical protein
LALFKFRCACGCGKESEQLNKDEYVRIYGDRKWYVNEHVPEKVEVLKEVGGGKIVREEDF